MTGTHFRALRLLAGAWLVLCGVECEPAAADTILPTAMIFASEPTIALSHVTIIQSNEALQIGQKEHKEWYGEGPWPLIGSVCAILITNTVAIGLVYLQSKRSFNALLRQRKIELLVLSLNDFYNPLMALIDINAEIFTKTGPPAFPEAHHEREAAGLVWKHMKKKVLENNREIELILKNKTHLVHKSDSLDAYKKLLVHVAMYETFQVIETDGYGEFMFPKEIRGYIVVKRLAVIDELEAVSGKQI